MSIKRVTTRAIEDGTITTEKIADSAVTSGKIAVDAVDSTKIADSSIVASKIASSAVTTAKIDDLAITADKIASSSVTTDKIANDSVTSDKIATGGPSWTGTGAGGVFGVPQTGLEFGTGHTQDHQCFIDLHSAATPTDFETRIMRNGGANGNFEILNNGTGKIVLTSSGGVSFGSATLFNPTGTAPIYGARAWVNFNGTGTVSIRGSGNVSSITDGGTGTYSVNFTFAMPDTNYSVTVTARRIDANNANFSAVLKGTTSANTNYPLSMTNCEVICGTPSNNAFVDSDVVCVSVFR